MKPPLDSRQLRAFSSLARTGNFTHTARELHVTQSSISHSIKSLEDDVGCRLLDRLGKKIVLTQAGEQLLKHARKALGELEVARSSLSQLGKWGHGRMRIGATTSACQYLIPGVLREFKESFPRHALSIKAGDTPELISQILNHQIDVAVGLEVQKEPELIFNRLFEDELQFLVDPQHSWARKGSVEREEIPRQDHILYSKESVTFRLIEDYFSVEKMVLNSVIEVGSMEATKELVKLGLGVSILAPWIARKEILDGSLVALPLGKRKLQRIWSTMHWRGKLLNLAEETFIGLCVSACAPLRLIGKGKI